METKYKRTTIYLEPELYKALKNKSAESECTISDLVNRAVRESLIEDYMDLVAFDERKDESKLNFEDVLKELKASGKL
ncbi:CopG family transcriptional regulator [candidate division KSB1 bacterium]|nr:CopG family transcriptional regulator [candidate division KSB1 bacterium]